MGAPQRLTAIETVDHRVRALLFNYMKKHKQRTLLTAGDMDRQAPSYKKSNHQRPLIGLSGVRTIQTLHGTVYRAHLVIKGLRLYTNTASYKDAIDHHAVFVRMRDAVASASATNSLIWADADELFCVFKTILDESTLQQSIEIRVFVYMRATPWLDKNTYITSPVMSLKEATALYVKLLCAQRRSWEDLRREWCLLQCRKRTKSASQAEDMLKGQRYNDALVLADKARHNALDQQFKQATKIVERAIKRRDAVEKHAVLAEARRKRILAKAKAQADALDRRVMKQRLKVWHARRRMAKRKYLTTEDLMRRCCVST
jgi:hypothetical protein